MANAQCQLLQTRVLEGLGAKEATRQQGIREVEETVERRLLRRRGPAQSVTCVTLQDQIELFHTAPATP